MKLKADDLFKGAEYKESKEIYNEAEKIITSFGKKTIKKLTEEHQLMLKNCIINYTRVLYLTKEYQKANDTLNNVNNHKVYQSKKLFIQLKIKEKLCKDIETVVSLAEKMIKKLEDDLEKKMTGNELEKTTKRTINDIQEFLKKLKKRITEQNKSEKQESTKLAIPGDNEDWEWKLMAFQAFQRENQQPNAIANLV